MTFPPPPPSPNDPPAPGQWQPAPQAPGPYGQPNPPQPYGQPPTTQSPGPYGVPAYPQQPMAPAPAPGRGWVVPTVVVASLVTIAAVFAASAAREGEAGDDAATEARDAVVRLTTALTDGDCEGVEAAATGGYFRSMAMSCADIEENAAWLRDTGVSFVIGDADLDRDSADVPVQVVVSSDPSQNASGVFTVVKTGETWRVSNDQTS